MFIIIDGYNLLKQIIKSPFATERERIDFITLMSRYAHAQKHEIHIVFDGGPDFRPTRTVYKYVTVIYSGPRQNADDYIKRAIENKKTKDMLIVSTDRKISSFAKQHGVTPVDSIDFFHLMEASHQRAPVTVEKPTEQPRKLTDAINPELDALMRETTRVMYKKEDQENSSSSRGSNPQMISRKEKKLLKIVKKL